jgi:hypothetical protein
MGVFVFLPQEKTSLAARQERKITSHTDYSRLKLAWTAFLYSEIAIIFIPIFQFSIW